MALTKAGFDGGLSETDWALIASRSGIDYSLAGSDDFKVTAKTLTLTVSVAAGTAYGYGVKVSSDAAVDVALDPISSGTRWDLISLRRNWSGTGGTVSIEKITGTATRGIPAGRNANPGVLDDQPLALVQVTSGQAVPTAVVDLRWRTSPVIAVDDLLAIPTPRWGMGSVMVGNTTYKYAPDDTGALAWIPDRLGSVAFPFAAGLVSVNSANPATMHKSPGGMISLRGTVKRSTGNLGTGSAVTLGTLASGWRPEQNQRFLVFGWGTTVTPTVSVDPAGAVILQNSLEQASILYVHLEGITFRGV